MLFKFSSSSYQYDGRVQNEVWTTSGVRGIGRTRMRPNPFPSRLRWLPPFTLAEGKSEWADLDEATQSDWEDFAAATFGWPLQGSPRYMDGETFFANYYTVLRLIDPAAAVPDVPLSGPSWQTKPKFFEFAEWTSGEYTLKAETDFDSGTVLIFSGLPPTTVGFKPDFAGEVIVGNHTFSYGLTANEEWTGLDAMMEAEFGPIDATQKIWGRVWEVQDGYIRTLVDPCTPDPGGEPPAAATSFEFIIYNNYFEDVDIGEFWFTDTENDIIATIDVSGLAGSSSMSGTCELDEGYDVDDLDIWETQGFWMDVMPWVDGPYDVDDIDPFEFTLDLF